MHLKLMFEPVTGKILGAQCVGKGGVDKRIDVLAMALQMGATVFDLEESELCYAPQYGAAKVCSVTFPWCRLCMYHSDCVPPVSLSLSLSLSLSFAHTRTHELTHSHTRSSGPRQPCWICRCQSPSWHGATRALDRPLRSRDYSHPRRPHPKGVRVRPRGRRPQHPRRRAADEAGRTAP